MYGAWHFLLLIKCCLQHVKFATKTDQVRTVFGRNFFECLQPEISSFLLFRVDISGLQLTNISPTSTVTYLTLQTLKEIFTKHCPNLFSFCRKFDML